MRKSMGSERRLEAESVARHEETRRHGFSEIVGESAVLMQVLHKVDLVAPTDSTVLIQGETGTGKELVARAIHERSRRAKRAFIQVNCAALPAQLIESELFGHEKGAFTGAIERKIGRFELADGATLFLDEIGELPLELQAKLLRVLQSGEFERVGSSKTLHADVRIIAATNRDLKCAVTEGRFRDDLFYRLGVFPIEMPSLSERKEDIPLLTAFFLERFRGRLGKRIDRINPDNLDRLKSYSWPGKIRELANVVERAMIGRAAGLWWSRISSLARPIRNVPRRSLHRRLVQTRFVPLRTYSATTSARSARAAAGASAATGGGAQILGLNSSTRRSRMNKLGILHPRTTVGSLSAASSPRYH